MIQICPSNKPLCQTGLLALLLIPFILIMGYLGPKNNFDDYSSAIVAFEFVSNNAELANVIHSEDVAKKLDCVNKVDFGFMLMYGIFLFLFARRFGQIFKNDNIIKSSMIVPVIVAADALENLQMFKLTGQFEKFNDTTSEIITLLITFTWTKWILLAAVFAIVASQLIKMEYRDKVIGYLLLSPIALGVIAFFSENNAWEDKFTMSIFGAFLLIFIFSMKYKEAPN